MPLVLNEEQRLLRDTARDFLASHAPVSALRKLRDERAWRAADAAIRELVAIRQYELAMGNADRSIPA